MRSDKRNLICLAVLTVVLVCLAVQAAISATSMAGDYALQFDGVDDYITVADDPSLRFQDTVSIEFWAKRQRFRIDIVLEKGGDWTQGQTNYGVGLHEINNKMCYFFYNGGWRGITGVSDFDWHHYAIIAQDGDVNPVIYIDGNSKPIEFSGGTGNIDLNPSLAALHIGAQVCNFSYYSANIIEEVSIWSYARTEAEIKATMYVPLTGTEPGLVGYWQFNEGTGQVVHDSSGNGNDGQLGSTAQPDNDDPSWVLSTLGEPVVNAGHDQTITLPAIANLDGTVTDDGLPNPPGAVTTQWTVQSGPGTVTFGNTNDVDTTASFSLPGTYVLRLTANDGEFSSYDEIAVMADVLNVPSDGTHVQSQPLLADVQYVIEASGTFYFNGPPPSAWITDAAWGTWPSPAVWLEFGPLWIDNQIVDWLGTSDGEHFYQHTFSPTHVYRYYMLGTGQPVDFFIYDWPYSDNYGSLQVTLTPIPKLNEVSSTETTLVETVHTERWILEDGNVVGDLNGTFDFNSFDIVAIKTGPWAGKGFSKAQCQATLEGATYQGEWRGIALPDVNVGKINLKGSITGEILATVEGMLTESVPGSRVYDQYQATWKIDRLGNVTTSVTVNATGKLTNLNINEYPSTGLYVLQTAMDGNLAGDYSGPLSTVINHVRVADGNNPYDGNGFSIISYVSQTGSGQGYTCDQLLASGVVTMKGLFTDPLYGVLSASLNEKTTPRALYLSLQRIDLGLPPMANLEVKIWGPGNVSPGQTINYIAEYRNDGLKVAENSLVIIRLPAEVNYISSTNGGIHKWETHEVIWKLGKVSPKTISNLAATVRVNWGLPSGTQLKVSAIIGTSSDEVDVFLNPELAIYNFEEYLTYKRITTTSVNSLTQEELEYELSDINFVNLYAYSIERGYVDINTPYNILYNHDSSMTIIPMASDTKREMEFVIKSPHNANLSYIMNISENTISFFNETDGFLYDNNTGEISLWGERHSCNWAECVNHCIGEKLGEYLGSEALNHLTKDMLFYFWASYDCASMFTRPLEERYKYFEACVKDIPGVGELAELTECMAECAGDVHSHGCREDNYCYKCRSQFWTGINGFGKQVCKDCLWADVPFEGRECPKGTHCNQVDGCRVKCVPDGDNSGSTESQVSVARDPSVKYGPEGNVVASQKLNYRVEYENEGEGIAFGVYFTDTLDEDLNDATLGIGPIIDVNTGLEIAPPGIYNPATRTITWFAGEVGPGQGGYSDVNICVRSDANDGTEIINYATIYFPSVPEETRTNGIVSVVSLNQSPVAEAGDNRIAFVGANCIAEVTLDGSGSIDPDGDDLTYTWLSDGQVIATGVSPTVELSLGQHTIVLVVNDGKEESEPDEVMITVQDIIPPEFVLSVTPNVLWPPNHKMVQVTPNWTVTDNCDKSPAISLVKIAMNEGDVTNTFDPIYDVNVADGKTAGDVQIGPDGSICLRAERAGSGPGRVYTITYEATDDSGNTTTRSATVTVPHDEG